MEFSQEGALDFSKANRRFCIDSLLSGTTAQAGP